MTKDNITKLKRLKDHADHISQRKLSIKFWCDQAHISKKIKKKTYIKKRSKTNIPKQTEAQIRQVIARVFRDCAKFTGIDLVIDDESYFTLEHSNIIGYNFFYSSNINETPANVKYRQKEKFQPKLLVWACFLRKRMACIFVVPSGWQSMVWCTWRNVSSSESFRLSTIPFW